MNAKAAALLVGANALVSAALIALVHLWLLPQRLPALAVLDVAELYRLKELQIAAVLVKRDASVGSRLVFEDMAYYTMVKITTFNGINLPSIVLWNSETDALRVVRRFGYEDFRNRLS